MSYLPLRIGLTGGIGSGKSRVGRILEALHFPVYYADWRARTLMTENDNIVAGVKELFGEQAYHPDGSVNRAWIGQQVFADAEKLHALNAVVHPETGRDFLRWDQTQRARGVQLTFKEAAILYESGAVQGVDRVWSVYAPKQTRLIRAQQRDGAEAEAILSRMARQWPELQKLCRADFVIYNDGRHLLAPQVRMALQHCRRQA